MHAPIVFVQFEIVMKATPTNVTTEPFWLIAFDSQMTL